MAEVELSIAGRSYRVACRDGEEDTLRAAGALVDAKSREALAGLGTLSEARQLLFASLLLADQLVEQGKGGASKAAPAPAAASSEPDPIVAARAGRLAAHLEALADALEAEGQSA
ncbi:cell division protein ZapA [Sphingomonas sp.]|uniref:cell division protein ZapA n=1 Tax=Sphingomonas sp. TaxID=28214 RepID=UPI00286E145C|nr:cell division protein ZapA [Sphingomonas sp.]